MILENEKILVVDDDEALMRLLAKTLERAGFSVSGYTNAVQALESLRSERAYGVLVTDLMMPGMNGMELIQKVHEEDPHLEVIVVTAAGSIDSAITVMRDGGAYDYLLKPLESLTEVTLVVQRALAHRELVLEREALREQMETEARRLQALITNVGEAILSASGDGVLRVANPAAVRLLGSHQLVDYPAYAALPAELWEMVESWQAVGGENEAVFEIPWREDTFLMVSLSPLDENSPQGCGWVMVLRDITLLKRLDDLKTQALADSVNKIRRPLAEAMGLLVDLNRSTLQDEAVNQQVYRLMEIWKKIQNWGDELLLLMRQDSLRLDQRSLVEVGRLCADIQRELRLEFEIPGSSRLCIQVDEPGLQLRTDREVLLQVLKGLVGRARDRSAANGEVHLDVHEFHGKVYFEVSDDGPPISMTGMLNVFGRSTEIATQPLGSGFDLARAKLIVEKMGGKLWIGGRKARGSTITVSLPTSGSRDTL
jgi:FixJ family two-component response regulator